MDEFSCPCCGKNKMDPQFLLDLDRAREFAKVPFIINSGYRCPIHNKTIKGSSPTSSHKKGLAVDIRAKTSRRRYRVLEGLILAGFTRIGIADTFIHVDSDDEKANEVCWVY